MTLQDIPKNSPMRIEFEHGWKECTFHHLDGMYSYCTVDSGELCGGVFHLSWMTPLELIDGKYHISDNKEAE